MARHEHGNSDVPYVTILEGAEPGPTAMISALIHGNELCGAVALDRLLSAAFKPDRGRLVLVFANMAAFSRFDSAHPYASRFIDEDMNRVWSSELLDGRRQSVELARARELRPFAEAADYLLDLHSTSLAAPAMLLCGTREKGLKLAEKMGYPSHVVADGGHTAGIRLRDFGDFDDGASAKSAMLVECGQHFDSASPTVALETITAFLMACGMLDGAPEDFPLAPSRAGQHIIEVSHSVTIRSEHFYFSAEYQCFEVIAEAGTRIARDGTRDVLTPYDDCVLVMPARQPVRGQTAVRFGRHVTGSKA
ncbi:MAG: succinylglutamate desuccinylase/aspartoacylase family protein [Alphaproteobacteria bacterium]|nr:succinylglutamate desuccinylase/aspartoacylase family protein [Alphaproteobacteria bacterium]MDP6819373.1 succinylglutamate desuccinylase/aspartoacylase family protein [Alphaproteobacteria bacterium]